jgi:hypothetical protein
VPCRTTFVKPLRGKLSSFLLRRSLTARRELEGAKEVQLTKCFLGVSVKALFKRDVILLKIAKMRPALKDISLRMTVDLKKMSTKLLTSVWPNRQTVSREKS